MSVTPKLSFAGACLENPKEGCTARGRWFRLFLDLLHNFSSFSVHPSSLSSVKFFRLWTRGASRNPNRNLSRCDRCAPDFLSANPYTVLVRHRLKSCNLGGPTGNCFHFGRKRTFRENVIVVTRAGKEPTLRFRAIFRFGRARPAVLRFALDSSDVKLRLCSPCSFSSSRRTKCELTLSPRGENSE